MKILADFGLEKIPTEVLLSMSRTECGELKAYITELEDKIAAQEIEIKSLKAYIESDTYAFTKAERKNQLKELRKDEYIKGLLKQYNNTLATLKEVRKRYKVILDELFCRINNLEKALVDNGIEIPKAKPTNPNSGDLSFLESRIG